MDLSVCGEKVTFLDRYRGNVAINVKYYDTPKLSNGTLEILSRLDGAVRENVLRFAEEATRLNWWAGMQELSREYGLGDLYSDGRSGGWLVFNMPVVTLEHLLYEVEQRCTHCDYAYDAHADNKCPFDATSFESEAASGLAKLEAFRAMHSAIKESLPLIGDRFEEEILFQLENLDDDGATGVSSPSGGSDKNPSAFIENPDE